MRSVAMVGVVVRLPRSLLEYWSAEPVVEVEGATLAEVIAAVEAQHPGVSARLLDDRGRIRRFVHVFVNREPVGDAAPGDVSVRAGDVVHVVPSVAGG